MSLTAKTQNFSLGWIGLDFSEAAQFQLDTGVVTLLVCQH